MIDKLISALFSFKGLYVAFVIAVVFYGQVRMMFGLTPRHIAIVVMFIACARQGISFPLGRIMKAYLLFVFTFVVSATLTGYLSQLLITYYIAACTGYWATKILVIKYNDAKLLLNTIIILGVINAVVTIGQMVGLPFTDQLVSSFHLKLPEKYLDKLSREGGEDMALMLTRPGLFNSAVYNGYFLMTTGVASLLLLVRKLQLKRLVPWIIIVVGCICVQERGPIIILGVLSAFAFYKILIVKKLKYFFLMTLFGLALYLLSGLVSSTMLQANQDDGGSRVVAMMYEDDDEQGAGYYSSMLRESRFAELGLEDTGRSDIYEQTTDYLMDHPFIGGYHRLVHMYNMAPHNLFLNAFIYGGIVGGVAILFILFWQVKPLWRVLRRKIVRTNPVCFFAGLAYVAFTLNSLAHNKSIVTGDEFLWMLWAGFYFEYRKYFSTPRL